MTTQAKADGPIRLAAKIAAVAAEMKTVPKNGTNKSDGYKYAMAADVFDAVRENLAKHKVAVFPKVDSSTSTIVERTKGVLATLWIDYIFVDGESDETQTARIVSTAADYGMADKAVFKAETNALKYLLFQVFQISTGDDDVENDTHAPQEDRKAKREPAPKAESKPAEAKGVVTDEQRADILFLNEQLGERKRTNKQLKETLDGLAAKKEKDPGKALIEILAGDHHTLHGVDCPHYSNGSDGAIVVKRG